jgi:hypothetical protein
MLEKRFNAVPPQPFIADGTANGKVTIADTRLFKVKQKVFLKSDVLPTRDGLEVKRIVSPTEMYIGPEKGNINSYSDLSGFLVADNAVIGSNEQVRSSIPSEEISRAVYEEEPTVAIRSMLVDKHGNDYRVDNPLPVSLSNGSVNIGSVNAELEVQLSHLDNYSNPGDVADSVRIGDGVNEAKITKAKVGTNTGLNTNSINELFSKPFTRLEVLTKNDDGDPLTIRSSYNGTPVQLMTIVYDSDGDFQSADVVDL